LNIGPYSVSIINLFDMKKRYTLTPIIWIITFLLPCILPSQVIANSSTHDSVVVQTAKIHSPELVTTFYQSRDHKPAWTKQGKYTLKAYRFIQILNHAQYYGLNEENYHLKEILKLKDANITPENTGRMESLLTDSFFAFAHHLKNGQLDRETMKLNNPQIEENEVKIEFLETALKAPSIKSELENLEPSHPHYHKLKVSLHEKLDSYNNIALWAGKKTEAMRQDILKVALNMERWRWEDEIFPDRHIFVNLPSYKLEVWENGKVSLESKVIVGSARHPTSLQNSQIEKYIIHPTLVPRQMLTEELLPSIVKDPSYLSRNAYEVLEGNKPVDITTINWEAFDADDFPYVVRRPDPGHKSLAILRFDLDSMGVLHDSESNSLFFRNVRALSGGCIIMEKAHDLAIYLVNEEADITPNHVKEYINGNEYKEIMIHKPMLIFIRYFTADGSEIYQDIYDDDRQFMAYFNEIVKENNNLNLQRRR
jgi:murein L,D-transpeptidase YcbB/YkuD